MDENPKLIILLCCPFQENFSAISFKSPNSFVYRGYFWAQFQCDWGRHCQGGNEEDENLPVLPSLHNAPGPGQPKVQLFNSACSHLHTMLLALGNPRYRFLTVLSPVHNAPCPEPQVQLFNSASLCTLCSWSWTTPGTALWQCFPLHTMLLVLNNPRYSFVTVLPSAHNATCPEQPQVQLFNSASFCTQCYWSWTTPGTAF